MAVLVDSPVTIKTIAERIGVTHGTVSRALKGDPRVKPETATRIQGLARQLGYSPSRVARGLRMRHTDTLGIIISCLTDPFYAQVIRGVHDTVVAAGYSLFVAATELESATLGSATQNLWEQRVDGLFVGCLPSLLEPFQQLMAQAPLPVVFINRAQPDYPLSVYNRDDLAIGSCLDHLLELGHRRIGYLGNLATGGQEEVRLVNLRAGLSARGLPLHPEDVFFALDGCVGSGLAASVAWLASTRERPTALMCYNDLLAIGLLRACRTAGVQVPQQLSVVGFDDIELSAYVEPALTTFAQPKYELGRRAGALMLGCLHGQPTPAGPQGLTGSLVVRASTQAPA